MPTTVSLCLALLCYSAAGLRLTQTAKGKHKVHKISKVPEDNADRIALFAVASDNPEYLKKVVVTFLHAKEMNKDQKVDLMVFGPFENPTSVNLLKDHGIDTMYMNIEGFDKSCNHMGCWPGVMHWWSAVPEKLADMGYKYSVFIDGGDVIAYRPLTMGAVKRALDGGSVAYKVTSLGQVNAGIIAFDNTRCKQEGLAREYLQFYTRHKNDDSVKDKDGVKDLQFTLSGRRGDNDYLRLLIRSIESPKQIQFTKLAGTSFGMVCRRGVASPIPEKWPYFVHLSNCHHKIPEGDQKGIPQAAYDMWAAKSKDTWGEVLSFDNKNSGEVKTGSLLETGKPAPGSFLDEEVDPEVSLNQDVANQDQ